MNIRPATEADESAIRTLWQEFEAEVPEPEGFAPDTWDVDWASLCENMRSGVVVVAEEDGDLIGFAEATAAEAQRWHLDTIHVRPESRRRGVGAALLRACVRAARARGARYLSLDALEQRLAPAPTGESQASIHVQSDDRLSVERALAQFVPRLETAAV
ncbi:MAG TPA: GNAT family N-acetyltransferase, partial [Gaiellaceae bacterium]|nr:GNAT family N-acetyltransferase [Gaiellaceae bacterium]